MHRCLLSESAYSFISLERLNMQRVVDYAVQFTKQSEFRDNERKLIIKILSQRCYHPSKPGNRTKSKFSGYFFMKRVYVIFQLNRFLIISVDSARVLFLLAYRRHANDPCSLLIGVAIPATFSCYIHRPSLTRLENFH